MRVCMCVFRGGVGDIFCSTTRSSYSIPSVICLRLFQPSELQPPELLIFKARLEKQTVGGSVETKENSQYLPREQQRYNQHQSTKKEHKRGKMELK